MRSRGIAALLLAVLVGALGFAAGRTERATIESVKLKWAHVYPAEQPYHQWALWAADEINKRTEGRYVIEVFPASTLAKEAELLPALDLGSVDIVYIGSAFIGNTYGRFAITEAPYVFESFEHWQNFATSDFFTELSEGYGKASGGNFITATTYYGFRCVTSNKPINSPADMVGLKIRVPGAPLYLMFTEALKANAAPIAFAEVYLALQQGVVDAQENPLPTIQAMKFYEVQKYINMTQHIVGNIFTTFSATTWNKIAPKDQEIIIDVTREAAARCSLDIAQAEKDLVAWFETEGVTINWVNKQPFIDAVAPSLTSSPRMTWTVDDYRRMRALR